MVAITPDGRLFARHFRTSVSSRTVIQVLRYVRRQIGTPLLVVWDRLNAHRSRATTDFIAAHAISPLGSNRMTSKPGAHSTHQ